MIPDLLLSAFLVVGGAILLAAVLAPRDHDEED